jgi:hypothetical protein
MVVLGLLARSGEKCRIAAAYTKGQDRYHHSTILLACPRMEGEVQ